MRFLGHVAPIQRAIEEAAIVVVPSMGEGFGMVALEAMERARPVIAAEIGGLGELVRDGETGFLVPPGEAEPLERGDRDARRQTSPRAAEMGAAGRRRALWHFLQDRLHGPHRAALRGRASRPNLTALESDDAGRCPERIVRRRRASGRPSARR